MFCKTQISCLCSCGHLFCSEGCSGCRINLGSYQWLQVGISTEARLNMANGCKLHITFPPINTTLIVNGNLNTIFIYKCKVSVFMCLLELHVIWKFFFFVCALITHICRHTEPAHMLESTDNKVHPRSHFVASHVPQNSTQKWSMAKNVKGYHQRPPASSFRSMYVCAKYPHRWLGLISSHLIGSCVSCIPQASERGVLETCLNNLDLAFVLIR